MLSAFHFVSPMAGCYFSCVLSSAHSPPLQSDTRRPGAASLTPRHHVLEVARAGAGVAGGGAFCGDGLRRRDLTQMWPTGARQRSFCGTATHATRRVTHGVSRDRQLNHTVPPRSHPHRGRDAHRAQHAHPRYLTRLSHHATHTHHGFAMSPPDRV